MSEGILEEPRYVGIYPGGQVESYSCCVARLVTWRETGTSQGE